MAERARGIPPRSTSDRSGAVCAVGLEGLADAAIPSDSRRSPGPVDRLATAVVLRRLGDLEAGSLSLRMPDGSRKTFGTPAAGLTGTVHVHRWRFFRRLLTDGDIGLGEAYMDGDWSTPDLVALTRVFLSHEGELSRTSNAGLLSRTADRLLHLARANTRRRARRNIRAHYDLGNDFYELFLDPSMTYSSAVFPAADSSLEQAQRHKYALMAAKAGLEAGVHVLEIGCGWGGFAEYAAGELGCRVTGITLSDAQATFARERIRRAGLDDQVDIRVIDYRDVRERFDAIVSIEMLEAVGHRYLETFFTACDRLLAPGGRVALQVITFPDQGYDVYRRGVDWIRKHIFPGGHLPSLAAMQRALAAHTGFMIHDVDNFALHYAETLRRWRATFRSRIDHVRALGFDDRFIRMWDFYLGICEAAFAHRKLGSLQLVLARPGADRFTTAPYAGPGGTT
jgi:cyclopropane-fatty-acyl-phospholipid synthase